jgi:hypothetical protein
MEDYNQLNPYKRFNSTIKEFIRELISIFPDQKIFRTFLLIYKIVKSISKKTPQKMCKQYIIANNRNDILNENDTFITRLNFEDESMPLAVKLVLKDTIGFYEIWKTIDEENKKIIWIHMKVIIALSDKCDQLLIK